jgi:hypothetical protein
MIGRAGDDLSGLNAVRSALGEHRFHAHVGDDGSRSL